MERSRRNWCPIRADEPGIPVVGVAGAQARAEALALLADPRLTGMSRTELDELAAQVASAQAARTEGGPIVMAAEHGHVDRRKPT